MAPSPGLPLRIRRRTLAAAERVLIRRAGAPATGPVLITGLPRSGTTLIYQYLVHRLRVAYFMNGADRYPGSPCLAAYLRRRRFGDYRSDFESSYGRVRDPAGPHEAGEFWARFFGYEDYVRFDSLDPGAVDAMRRSVACAERVFGGAPFVNKNVKHLLRMDALARTFPRAVFVIVERDLPHVALSLLRARTGNDVPPDGWWSVRPDNHAELVDLSVPERVAHQVVRVARRLEADLAELAPERVVRVAYREFCGDPERLVGQIKALVGAEETANPATPRFPCRGTSPANPEEERLLAELDRLIRTAPTAP